MQHTWKVIHLFLKKKYLAVFLQPGSFKKMPVFVWKNQSKIIWNNGHDSDFYQLEISNIIGFAELYQVPLQSENQCLFSYTECNAVVRFYIK